jgi:hypothetical protein
MFKNHTFLDNNQLIEDDEDSASKKEKEKEKEINAIPDENEKLIEN